MIGGPLIVISGTIVLLGGSPAANGLKGPAAIPEIVWELFLGVYCTWKGFRPSASILQADARPRDDRATAAPATAPA
jgi:hypothetical protein